jgi:hypothetical protein
MKTPEQLRKSLSRVSKNGQFPFALIINQIENWFKQSWRVISLFGGIIVFSYFVSIEFSPELDISSVTTLIGITGFLGLLLVCGLLSLFAVPGFLLEALKKTNYFPSYKNATPRTRAFTQAAIVSAETGLFFWYAWRTAHNLPWNEVVLLSASILLLIFAGASLYRPGASSWKKYLEIVFLVGGSFVIWAFLVFILQIALVVISGTKYSAELNSDAPLTAIFLLVISVTFLLNFSASEAGSKLAHVACGVLLFYLFFVPTETANLLRNGLIRSVGIGGSDHAIVVKSAIANHLPPELGLLCDQKSASCLIPAVRVQSRIGKALLVACVTEKKNDAIAKLIQVEIGKEYILTISRLPTQQGIQTFRQCQQKPST